MKLVCRYFTNKVRLANVIMTYSERPSFRFFCINGTISKNKSQYSILTPRVTVVIAYVGSDGKNTMQLLTNDSELSKYDGRPTDIENINHDSVFYNLCVLLKEKCATTGNPATMEFKSDKMTVSIGVSSASNSELECTVRGVDGDVKVSGDDGIKDVLVQCKCISSFSYQTDTEDCQREVTVRKSRGEILKEVARYLNRTIVIVSLQNGEDMLEQYISSTGMLEVTTRADGTKVYHKVVGSRLRDADPFCIYQSMARIEDIIREQGRALAPSLRGSAKNA